VTPKGQTRDPIIFEAPYLYNTARQKHGDDGPFIVKHWWWTEWSLNWQCLLLQKDERIIDAVQFEIKLIFFYRSKQLTDYIYMGMYCKVSKCIGQTPCSYEHYLVLQAKLDTNFKW